MLRHCNGSDWPGDWNVEAAEWKYRGMNLATIFHD